MARTETEARLRDSELSRLRAYFGWVHPVNSGFAVETANALYQALTMFNRDPSQRTTGKAYSDLQRTVGPGGEQFVQFGNQDLVLEGDLVVNGGFEAGDLTGWTVSGFGYETVVTENPAEGTYSARIGRWDQEYTGGYPGGFDGPRIGGAEPDGVDQISQTIALPSPVTSLSYQFDYDVVSYDGADYDWFDALVVDASTGAILSQPVSHVGGIVEGSPANWGLYSDTGWRHVTVDLTPFAGKTIKLVFDVTQDGFGDQTAAYLDGVSITGQ